MNPVKLIFDTNINSSKELVEDYTKSKLYTSQNLYRKTLLSHYACVNSVAFSNDGQLFVSGGDDKRVLLWKTMELSEKNNAKPVVMTKEHYSNIFSTVFDCSNKFIFSAGNDQQVLQHDIARSEAIGFFFFDDSIYGVDTPYDSPSLFAAAGEDGTVQIVDIRSPLERTKLTSSGGSYHSAVFNPIEPQLLATANSIYGVSLWDIRRPMKVLMKLSSGKQRSGMSVRFDALGNRLLALFRKGGPVLYDITSCDDTNGPIKHQFVHESYKNVCTMKTACFAGNKDEYVVSGSDDFNIYMWKIPDDEKEKDVTCPHLILQGHRSIVNQVRYNKQHFLLASAGVEKCVKIWSCFPMRGSEGDLTNDEHYTQRTKYTHEQYLRLTAESGRLTHDYEEESIEEDPRMIALFDSLIERTQNDWASDSGSENEGRRRDSRINTILNLLFDSYSTSSSSSSENEEENNTDNEGSRAFGVSIDELRRIFRRNRETVEIELANRSSRSPPVTMATSSILNSNQRTEVVTDTSNILVNESTEAIGDMNDILVNERTEANVETSSTQANKRTEANVETSSTQANKRTEDNVETSSTQANKRTDDNVETSSTQANKRTEAIAETSNVTRNESSHSSKNNENVSSNISNKDHVGSLTVENETNEDEKTCCSKSKSNTCQKDDNTKERRVMSSEDDDDDHETSENVKFKRHKTSVVKRHYRQ